MEYVYSIGCWDAYFKGYSEEEGIQYDGFVSKNGGKSVAIECYPWRTNRDDEIYYPNPINLMTAPAIYRDIYSDGNIGCSILNPLEHPSPEIYSAVSWFPDQGVLVVTDGKDNYGLVSFDGTILFPLQNCRIYTNDIAALSISESFHYDTYNDTDYLLFSAPMK